MSVENPPQDIQDLARDPTRVADIEGFARYRFRLDEEISGGLDKEFDVYGGRGGGGDCSYHFKVGAQYLVFVHQEQDGRFFQIPCSPTDEVSEAAARLPQLRALRDRRRVASLFGILGQGMLSPEQRDKDLSYEGEFPPLAFTAVYLRNEVGKTWQTQSGANGVYAFYDLPAGTYRLWAGSNPQLTQPAIELPEGACYDYRLSFGTVPTGEIWGRAFDPEGQVLNCPVSLFRVEQYEKEDGAGREEYPDDNGYFHFRHVAPGKYYVILNSENCLGADIPFPRTFFPGTQKQEEAIVIDLQEDGRYPNADIRLRALWPKPTSPPRKN